MIDASGPWQAYGEQPYRVAEAAISIGAHYLDLADGRDFVLNIKGLDAMAGGKNVFVLSGASTCPALTMAVARSFSDDLVYVDSISAGLAPAPQLASWRSTTSYRCSLRWTCAGIPMPKSLMPHGDMHETVQDGRFRFHVEINVPHIGHIVTYEGWFENND